MRTAQQIIEQRLSKLGMFLAGQLEQTLYIDYTDPALSQGIVDNAEIMEPSAPASQRTALILQSGSLPYTFRQVSLSSCPR
jgi:hypothetical protein